MKKNKKNKLTKKNKLNTNNININKFKNTVIKNIFIFLGITLLLITALITFSNIYIINYSREYLEEDIYKILNDKVSDSKTINNIRNSDYILILGAGIFGEEPSPLLKLRLDLGIELYKNQFAPKIIMTGDHSTNHDEVSVMKNYAMKQGVNPDDIIVDGKGYSTYESMYQANINMPNTRIVVVTQKFHLSRAIYLARSFNLDATGVAADQNKLNDLFYLECREILARTKDLFYGYIKPKL